MAIKQYEPPAPREVRSDFPESADPANGRQPGPGVGTGKRYQAPTTSDMAFRLAPDTVVRRAIVSLEGERKTGKLHAALTFPEPVYVHSFDIGTEGVVEKFRDGRMGRKVIYLAEYPSPDANFKSLGKRDDVMNEAIRVYQAFRQQYYDSLEQTKIGGTVVIDKGGQAFDMLTLAEFGRTERILPRNRGKINGPMAAMVRAGYGSKNVVWLHDVKDKYRDAVGPDGSVVLDDQGEIKSVKTGERIPRGFGDMPYIVQMVGKCERVDLAQGGSQFQIRITDARHNPWANGLVIENNFEAIAWALHEYVPQEATDEAAGEGVTNG